MWGGMGGGGWGQWNSQQTTKAKAWATDAFISEFCDPFADDLSTSSDVMESWTTFLHAVEFLQTKLQDSTACPPEIAAKCKVPLDTLRAGMASNEMMMRKYSSFQQWKMQYYLSKMLDDIAKCIQGMEKVGDFQLLPLLLPDTHDSGVCMVVEYLDSEFVRVTIVNPTATSSYHPKSVDKVDPTKIKQQVALTVSKVKKTKICSEAWWSCTMLGAKVLPKEDVFYTHFLSWLTGRTHEGQLADYHTQAVYATPAKSANTVFWKSLVHALKYILRVHGLSNPEIKFVRHFIKIFLLEKTEEDLDKVKSIKFSSKKMIESALQSTAMSITRSEALFPSNKLEVARKYVENLHGILLNVRCDDDGRTPAPPELDITHGWDLTQQPELYPLMECHRRVESVEQFVGAATETARAVPVNFLRIPSSVTTLDEAIFALNETVMLITRIVGQRGLIKNHALLVVSLLNHVFLEVLPTPLGPITRKKAGKKCIWSDTPMRYGQQLHIMQRLLQCSEYYMSGIFTFDGHLENDGLRITVAGIIATLTDAVVRVLATDKPSLFSVHLTGYKGKDGFVPTPGKYMEQTEGIQFIYPEAVFARAAIIDYYHEVMETVPATNHMWKWEDGVNKADKACARLFRQLAHSEALQSNSSMHLMGTLPEGPYSVLTRQFAELESYRNTTFNFKYLMNPSFPHKTDWLPMYSTFQRWDHREGEGFDVQSWDGVQMRTDAKPRFPTFASPSIYVKPHEVHCEEDILHIKNLTTFEDVMGQRDSELLLSYLTVPYLRIPLLLRFFATEDRISCLKVPALQNMLSGCLFEPSRFLTRANADVYPQEVPSEKAEYIACPYGLLLNELFHSTQGVLEPLVRMVQLAAELDAGTVHNELTLAVILYLVKTLARIHNYINFALKVQERSVRTDHIRGVEIDEASKARLQHAYTTLSELSATLLMPMLESWTAEAMRNATEAQRTDDIDKATALASRLYAHQILLLRNIRPEHMNQKNVASLLAAFAFLTTRYTWYSNVLPELELYHVIHKHRRAFIRYLTTCPTRELNSIMDTVVRVVTSAGNRDAEKSFNWGYLAGPDCIGRYARLDEEVVQRVTDKGSAELMTTLQSNLGLTSLPEGVVTIPEGIQEVELNIHTITLTFKNAHLRALPSEIAGDSNVFMVFAPLVGNKQKMLETMQCAIVEDATNRLWVRLVGQDHDIQFWRTPDPRFAIPNDTSMRFYPDDLAETEKWVEELFEPVRSSFFERSFWDPPIFILIQEHKLTADNHVAQLSAIDSQSGKKLKEIYVFRDYRCVHTYDIVSHGRRFYRRLMYTTDAHYCLMSLQPPTDRRAKPWPAWARHAAGDADPDTSTETPQTSVILRHANHPENISNATETFVPPTLLYGLIPHCLLETHRFWQDPDDNIRGYPIQEKDSPNKAGHILWLHWREAKFDPTGVKNTCMQIYRFAKAKNAPKSSEEAVIRSQKLKTTDETDEELAMTRAKSDEGESGTADLQAGAFRQSSTMEETKKSEVATIEDNNLLLIDLMYARKGTPLYSLARVLTRLETLSHILVWTTQTDYDSSVGGPVTLDLIQLPRLKLTFSAKLAADGSTYLLYSLDHAHLFISNQRQPLVVELLQGVPHSLILADTNGATSIIVPALNVVRPTIIASPFTTELVINRQDMLWLKRLETRYYLYPVHVSLSFMFTPTLASALYLLLLRFLHRNYTEVFRLSGTIGTDMEFTPEEHQIFQKLVYCNDSHPNAYACRSKISLLVSDSPVTLLWYPPEEVSYMIALFNHVTVSCRLTQSEERRLLYLCDSLEKKMAVIRELVTQPQFQEGAAVAFQKIQDRNSTSDVTMQSRTAMKKFYAALTTQLREKLDVRVVREDLNRLLATYNNFAQKPMNAFHSCLLHNRRQIIEGERTARLEGKTSTKVWLKVPPMGEDLKWLFYDDFNPHSVKAPGSALKEKNDEGRVMTMSKAWDYFYCGAQVRKPNTCRCRGCNEHCGPTSGCPCGSCEKYNVAEGHLVRELIPILDATKSARNLSFFEAFLWINEAVGRYATYRRNKEYPYLEKQTAASLREPGNAFLRFYEMLTGTSKVKICATDCARDLAQLLFHFSREARNPAAALGHMMHFLVSTPQTWSRLPKFNRTSKQKIEQRTMAIYNGIWAQAAVYQDHKAKLDFPTVTFPSEEEREIAVRATERTVHVPLHLTTILPVPNNTDCSKRFLRVPDAAHLRLLGNEVAHLKVTEETLKDLGSLPLRPVLGENLVSSYSRQQLGLPPVPKELPFDLSKHEDSRKTVAKDMLKRIEADMEDFARQQNEQSFPKLTGLTKESEIRALVTGKTSPELKTVRAQLEKLYERVVALRAADGEFLAYAMPVITRTANYLEFAKDRTSSLLYLRRFAGKEATLTLDYLLASLCSSTAAHEWQQLNPFVSAETCEALFSLITVTVLRANRVGHVNRVCEAVKDLLSLLNKAEHFPPGLDNTQHYIDAIVASLVQKADSVATLLLTPRVYISHQDMSFDPRFLLFEFTWNLVLRERQREQILEMYQSIMEGKSSVKQMIMGAGKTTVVGPLLALMLADSTNLVIQVVPQALLDFTRAVLRTTFSTVLQKQIFTFACDRATEVDSEALSKFEHAKQSRGIVVTTPSSIKSVFLKYVEGLDRVSDTTRAGRTVEMEKENQDILNVLKMWRQGVLIMDEVDLLLHPLKSELNFPVGAKENIDFTPTRWKLPIHLIDTIFYYHTRRITTAMKESPDALGILQRFRLAVKSGLEQNALQEMPHLTLLNLTYYDEVLKPILADWILLFLKAQHLVGLSDAETISYLLKRPNKKDNPTFAAKVEALEVDHIKMLNLSFEWLNCFMPHIMQKIDRVSFGIMNSDDMKRARDDHPNMPRSRFVTAIPFVGKDLPSQSSEFAHPDIVIGLTVLAYRYEGLRMMDFSVILREIHAMVEKEVGRFSQRRTNIMYQRWVQAAGGKILASYNYNKTNKKTLDRDEMGMQPSESVVFDENGNPLEDKVIYVLPLKLMKQANQQEVDKLFKLFKRTAEPIHWYLCESIFPEYMRHQQTKLSASGQELGGTMIFQRRIGFSGTPSDLLPIELGRCGYEPGTDGQLIHTLSDPNVMSYTVVETGWSVRTLLERIANANPPYHALIDTGALITGMSNLQVAQYLLKHGLPQMEGVVFLDELDRKMILVRATGRVLKLAECGIPKVKRFAFYDQVHTTGMDIEHTPNAVAVQTLGKDMTFRDFSQGAYRMRGIGQGQLVRLLIIPEVYDLINRTLKGIRPKDQPPIAEISKRSERSVLVDVTSWLLVNSIRSEHTQHNQLCIQSCANVWRKEAFATLSARVEEFKVADPPSAEATKALSVYREPINFEILAKVPNIRMFSEAIAEFVAKNGHLVSTPDGEAVVKAIMDQTKREDEVENPVIDVQMVQEQEEEKEAEQEQEKEQEIEIEKFVDLAYSRDEEAPAPWKLETLTDPARAVQFYKLQDFHLYKRRPIDVPDSIMLSKNYFNPKWAGHRRMKNVVVTMEWIPSLKELELRQLPSTDYGAYDEAKGRQQLTRTLKMIADHQHSINESLLVDLLVTALHIVDKDSQEMRQLVTTMLKKSDGKLDPAVFYETLKGNALRLEDTGRYTVAVNLAEAETLRRLIHMRQNKTSFIEGSDVAIALNLTPSNNAQLDATRSFIPAKTGYFPLRNYQVLRYFDCDLHYSTSEFGLLLRSLHTNPEKHRQAFFQQIIATRRRSRQRWESTPIALLFNMKDAFTLFQQRAVGLCIRRELDHLQLNLGDAYIAFNHSHSGILTADEVWGATRFCRLQLTCEEVLDFIDVADTHCEGTIQYPDFICVLTGSRELEEGDTGDQPDDAQGKKLPVVEPYGSEDLKAARIERLRIQRAQEAEANKEMESETQRVMDEIEMEQINDDIAQINETGNPLYYQDSLTYSFMHPNLPKLVVPVGAKVRRPPITDDKEPRYIEMHSNSGLKFSYRLLKRLAKTTNMDRYCLSVEFQLPKPKRGDPKNGVLAQIAKMGKNMNLMQWPVPIYRFSGYGSAGAPVFEVEVFGATGGQEAAQAGLDAELARMRAGMVPQSQGLFAQQRAPGYANFQPPQQQTFGGPAFTFGSSSGAPNLFGAPQRATAAAGSGGPTNEMMHIFAEPKPPKQDTEALAVVKPGEMIIATGKKTSNSIDGVTYEWMFVSYPVDGWMLRERNGRSYWEQLGTTIYFAEKGFSVDHGPIGSSSADHIVPFDESNDAEDVEGQPKKDEEDPDDDHPVELTNEVGDLLEALRKAKRLKPGDKVVRNKEVWDKGNEDGGEGSVGKVLKVETDKVQVQWPSGNKGNYLFGSRGIFELVKVGEADEDDDGEQRETMNDERWLAELRKGGQKCSACSAAKLEPSNWFRCNHCESYHLCKKCFRAGNHNEHDFTDMNALNNSKSNELTPGAYVRVKLSVTNPKYGWDGTSAKPGATGSILEVDADENWASVELEDGDVWRADLGEIEIVEDAGGDEHEEAEPKQVPFANLMSMDPIPGTMNLPFLQSVIDTARQLREGKFKVGDRVKVKRGGSMYPAEIKACLPGKEYAIIIESLGSTPQNNVPERDIFPCSVKVGDRIRFKRTLTNPVYGIPWDEKERKKKSGIVQMMSSGGQDYVKVIVKFEGHGNVNVADKDLDVIGNGKWTFTRTIDGKTDVIVLPTSSNVAVERAFEDGTQNVNVFIRDDSYALDLSNGEVRRGTALVGKIVRDPPEPFVKGEVAARLDDGNPHVVSVFINREVIAIYVDGKPAPVSFTGALQAIKEPEKYRVALATSLAIQTTTPVLLLYSQVSAEMAKASIGSQGASFPQRRLNWVRLDWDKGCTAEEIQAWHYVIDATGAWACKECGACNSRQLDACEKCKNPRVSKKSKDSDNKAKFRAGLAKSRDAQAVRSKLQGKLRAMYQRELDILDEAAAAAEASQGANGGNNRTGGSLPIGPSVS